MKDNCDVKPRPTSAKEFFKSSYFWKPFLGIAFGSIGGYLYFHFVGCTSGSCPITGNPYMSVAWGGLLGLFVVNSPCRRCK